MELAWLADISQVVSAVAVVVSLMILVVEVRRAAREVVMASQQAQANAHAEYLLALATEPELVKLMRKFVAGEPLDAVEALQQGTYYHAMMVQFQAAFHSAQALGKSSGGNWSHAKRALTVWTSNSGFVQWWARGRLIFDPEFVALVDGRIADAPPEEAGAAGEGSVSPTA